MREKLLDIVKHTGDLGFLQLVKVTGTDDETLIESIDQNKLVILKGTLLEPENEFVGEFGLNNLSLLKFYCNYANFKSDNATIATKKENRGGDDIIAEISFTDENKESSATYRVMNASLVPKQQKFMKDKWDILFKPSPSKINEFSALASGFASLESYFMPKTDEDGNLRFYIGDENAATNKASMVFEKDVKFNFPTGLNWPIAEVLAILKLAQDSKSEIEIGLMEVGALQISFKSKFGDWKYIFPAKRK